MPMIDVYATEGTFSDKHTRAQDLAKAVMRWEQVPEIPLFLDKRPRSSTTCQPTPSRLRLAPTTTYGFRC